MDLIEANRSTIVFANSRRLAERLTGRLNEIHAERAGPRRSPRRPTEPARPHAGPDPLGSAAVALIPGQPRSAPARSPNDGPGRADLRGRAPAGPRPPRVSVQGTARADRGRPQVRAAALRGGDQQPGAGHRHGRGGPGHPGRVPALGRLRPAARGPRRPPGRRDSPRRLFPQAPRGPGQHRRGGGAHAGRPDRGALDPGQPAGHPRAADRGRVRARRLDMEEWFDVVRRSAPVRHAAALRVRGHPGPAGRQVPLRRVRRAAPADRLGPRAGTSPDAPARSAWP